MASPCFICNTETSGGAETSVTNVTNVLKKTTMSQVSAISILTNILPDIESLLDTQICSRCYNLLDTIDTLQVQLKFKRTEVVNLYENSKAQRFKQENNNSMQDGNHCQQKPPTVVTGKKADPTSILVSEPPKKKDKGLLTSDDLKCQVCSKTFDKRRYLMDHLRRVHNSAIYQCKGCLLRFRLKEELSQHQEGCDHQHQPSVTSDAPSSVLIVRENQNILTKRKKNNKCQLCDAHFLTKALLKTHLRTVHGGESPEDMESDDLENETKVEAPVVCPLCHITVNNRYALSIHQVSCHPAVM